MRDSLAFQGNVGAGAEGSGRVRRGLAKLARGTIVLWGNAIMQNVRLEIHDTGVRSVTDHCAYQSIRHFLVIKLLTLAAHPSSFFLDPPPL